MGTLRLYFEDFLIKGTSQTSSSVKLEPHLDHTTQADAVHLFAINNFHMKDTLHMHAYWHDSNSNQQLSCSAF